jgi:hypothetical protein
VAFGALAIVREVRKRADRRSRHEDDGQAEMELAPVSTGLDALTGAWLPEGGGSLAIEVSEEKAATDRRVRKETSSSVAAVTSAVQGGADAEELNFMLRTHAHFPRKLKRRNCRD